MGADDAVRAAEFIQCGEILGVHYDTFPQIKIDQAKAREKFAAKGDNLHLLKNWGNPEILSKGFWHWLMLLVLGIGTVL